MNMVQNFALIITLIFLYIITLNILNMFIYIQSSNL